MSRRARARTAAAAAALPRPAGLEDVLALDAGASGMLLRHLLASTDRRALACCSRGLAQEWTPRDEVLLLCQLRMRQLAAARRFHEGRARPTAGPLIDLLALQRHRRARWAASVAKRAWLKRLY